MPLEVIKVTPPLVTMMDNSKAHPINYTTTLYDASGKLIDDGYTADKQVERTYWEAFVDTRQARELERRLALIESPEYVPGSIEWEEIEIEQETDEE